MTNEQKDFDWKTLPKDLEERGKTILKAGLGVLDVIEEQGERLINTMKRERGDVINDIQVTGSKAVDRLQDQANDLVEDLVTRGERIQTSTMDRAGDAMTALAKSQRSLADRIEEVAKQLFAGVLKRVDMPTKNEVFDLTARVEQLTAEVERLASLLTKGVAETDAAASDAAPDDASTEVVFEVASADEEWVVRNVGSGDTVARFATKGDAVRRAREIANEAAPSALKILKMDGSVQDTAHYV